MKVDEFIKEVNKVAFARYNKEVDELSVYTNTDCVHHNEWFLLISPRRPKDIIEFYDWDCLFAMDPQKLGSVLKLVRELEDTPVNERFLEKHYVLLAHPDSKRDFMTDALKYVSLIESTEDEFAFHYGPATVFSEDSLAAIAQAHPFIKPAIDEMKKEVH